MGDLSILDGTQNLDWLKTAISISLFSDLRFENNRGFWADDKLGSKLWLLDRETLRSENLVNAEQYTTEALGWIVEDGYLDKIKVTATYRESNLILKIDPIGLNLDYDAKAFLK